YWRIPTKEPADAAPAQEGTEPCPPAQGLRLRRPSARRGQAGPLHRGHGAGAAWREGDVQRGRHEGYVLRPSSPAPVPLRPFVGTDGRAALLPATGGLQDLRAPGGGHPVGARQVVADDRDDVLPRHLGSTTVVA